MSQYRRLFQEADRPAKWMAGLFLFAVLHTICIVGQMIQLSRIIDAVFLHNANLSQSASSIGFLAGWIFARGWIIQWQTLWAQRGAIRFKTHIRSRLLQQFFAIGPARVNHERTGEITATLLQGIEKMDAFYARYVPRAIQAATMPLLIAVFVATQDLLSGFILFATAPLIPIFMILIGGLAKQRSEKQWTALSRMSAHFLDVLQGLTTLKLFGRSHDQERDIRRMSNRYRLTTMGVLKIAFVSGLVLELAASLSTAIVAVQIGVRLVEGYMLFQPGLLILLLAPEFYLPFRHLGAEHHAAMEGHEAAKRIFAWLDEPVIEVTHEKEPSTLLPSHSIRLDQVSYTYPDRDQPAVVTCSIAFEQGKVTALVGASGSGKSTLLQLLCKHIEPTSGHLFYGDQPLTTLPSPLWRRHIAWVGQHPALFYGTVLDNMVLARPDASAHDIERAIQNAELTDVVARLPQGLQTPLGEQGWRLSGGERQRMALARAFLKHAPILIMDEPTANLDPDSEEKIAAAFERLAKDCTVILVAHRLRSVYRADHIHVMQHGRIVESGSHDELTRARTHYAQWMSGGAA